MGLKCLQVEGRIVISNVKTTRREELTGIYQGQRFFNPETRFIIGFLADKSVILGPIGDRDLIPGVEYRFLGKWEDSSYGKQFKFETFLQAEPHSRRGVIEYLKRIAPGVGDVTANKLCDLYGPDNCIAELKRSPEKVAIAIPHLRNGKAQEAAAKLIEEEKFQETRIDLLGLIAGRGFPGALIDQAIAKWGIHAAKRIRKDPFCLLVDKMPGCGFLRVDRLYQELGNELDRITRRVVCCWHVVREDRTGSTWVKWETVKAEVEKLITGCPRVEVAIEIAVHAGWLAEEAVEGEVYLAEAEQAKNEKYVAERLAVLV